MAALFALQPLENHPLTEHPSPAAVGLYVHVPFCAVKCRFCDFAAFPGRRSDVPRYLRALAKEIQGGRPEIAPLATFYVGGGTPSLLTPPEWDRLLEAVRSRYAFTADAEASLEANPDDVSDDKLSGWRRGGFNRLSMGLQTEDPSLLAALGRTHSWRDFVEAFRRARRAGFSNINVDLMYGLPGQTLAGWGRTLNQVIDLGPEHVSAYGLQIEEGTWFSRSGVGADEDQQADMYEAAAEALAEGGYRHYEISNFARPGFECRHNMRTWNNLPTLGVGVSAAGYDGRTRSTNTDRLTDYLERVESGRDPVVERVRLPESQRRGEDLMLALRMSEGVVPSAESEALYGPALDRAVGQGLLVKEADRYRPTRKGWRLSNRLFVDLLGG